MKKKNLLIAVTSLALVGVIAVGGTLAAMTATADAVTNTFTFADNMVVTLTEPQPEQQAAESIVANNDNGYDYKNIVPGQQLDKEPTITVTTDVPAYVFVKVSGATSDLEISAITTGWTLVGTADAHKNGVYYKEVAGNDAEQDLGTIFTTLTVGNPALNADDTVTLNDIEIAVSAIQTQGFDTVAAALAAAPAFATNAA